MLTSNAAGPRNWRFGDAIRAQPHATYAPADVERDGAARAARLIANLL
jgi:hypothetical protein